MISRLVLDNWKTHKHSELSFGKGTNVLVGVMGSGKTAVTDAISFCLFGTFPALQSRRVSLDEIVMAKPETAERAKLLLEFDYEKKNYSVERTVSKGKKVNEAKLYCEGRLIAGPKVGDVNEKIEEILEVTFDLFSRAVYSEQNQIDFFLRLSPSERKEKFDELLEINKYETARSNSVTAAGRIKRTAEDKKSFVKEQKQRFNGAEISELQKRIAGKKERQKELEKELGENEKLERELGEKEKKLEEKEKEFRFLKDLATKGIGKAEALECELNAKKKELDGFKEKNIDAELKAAEKKKKNCWAR